APPRRDGAVSRYIDRAAPVAAGIIIVRRTHPLEASNLRPSIGFVRSGIARIARIISTGAYDGASILREAQRSVAVQVPGTWDRAENSAKGPHTAFLGPQEYVPGFGSRRVVTGYDQAVPGDGRYDGVGSASLAASGWCPDDRVPVILTGRHGAAR